MTTYYVDGAVGNDGNAGTSEGAGNAWATVDHAMNTVAPGDHVYIKASATYSETPNIDTAGTVASPIIFEGYSSTPGDDGKADIAGATNCLTGSTASTYYIFKNLTFNGASSIGVSLSAEDYCLWYNCEFSNNGNIGFFGDNNHFFVNCEAINNSGVGIDVDNNIVFIGCVAGLNTGAQMVAVNGYLAYRNVGYGGTGTSDVLDFGQIRSVIGNTADGEGTNTDAISAVNQDAIVVDNIAYDAVNGFANSGSYHSYAAFYGYNLTNSNSTADYTTTGESVGVNDQTGAPAFTDEASDDYTLDSASPAKNAGVQPGGIT
jgi:hypothetical protein